MNQQRSRRFRASKEGMEAAEEKQKIRQEILAKGRAVVLSEVFQWESPYLITSVRFREWLCVHCREKGRTSLGKAGSVFSKVKNWDKTKCHLFFFSLLPEMSLCWVLLIPFENKLNRRAGINAVRNNQNPSGRKYTFVGLDERRIEA